MTYFDLLRLRSAQVAQHKSLRANLHNSKFKTQNPKFALGVKGFTLVEIAVVMVILGVVFMSVLKIESMVRNAKIRQVISQYYELRTAILIYKDKYGYLPGDDKYADLHFGATTIAGNGDHKILQKVNSKYEFSNLVDHLSKAGLIKSTTTTSAAVSDLTYPLTNPEMYHALKGCLAVFYATYSGVPKREGNAINIDEIPPDAAQAIDTFLDDGNSTTGFIRGVEVNTTSGVSKIIRSPHNYTETGTGYFLSLMIFIE